jgi:hypothetical protein
MQEKLRELFEDVSIKRKIQEKLPKLFAMAQM